MILKDKHFPVSIKWNIYTYCSDYPSDRLSLPITYQQIIYISTPSFIPRIGLIILDTLFNNVCYLIKYNDHTKKHTL